jgi:hypothetical protein
MYTFRKLLIDPYEVVEAYKYKDPRICTPFSLIVLVFSLFFFVSLQTGLDDVIFAKADKMASKTGILWIGTVAPFLWSNLTLLLSCYVVMTCAFLSIFTRKLELSFYDHVVANLYNLAIIMAPTTILILFLPLIDFDFDIFNLMIIGLSIVILFLKKIRLRILFYYREDVRNQLKKPMFFSGMLMALVVLIPFILLVIRSRI